MHTVIKLKSFGRKERKTSSPSAAFSFDARFLANPHSHGDLRNLDGRDIKVRDFVMMRDNCAGEIFAENIASIAESVAKVGTKNGYTTQPIFEVFCYGGKHRSVAIVEQVAKLLKSRGISTGIKHMEL